MSNLPPQIPHATNVVQLATRAPERLVGVGFRCWMQGLTGADIGCWEDAFTAYSQTLGSDRAKDLLIDLSLFVRAVSTSAERPISVQPSGCAGFCRDECLAISIIAACQHGRRDALCASACALIGCDAIGDAVIGAQTFAERLAVANQWLAADSVCPAVCALRVGQKRLI